MPESSPEFRAHIEALKLRHFVADELIEPPRDLWLNGVGVLAVADAARHELGFPLRITSSYRDPERNRKAGGVARSRHLLNEALDLRPSRLDDEPASDVTDRLLRLYHLLGRWRREGRIFPLQVAMRWASTLDMNGETLKAGTCWKWTRASDVSQPVGAFQFVGGLGLYPTFVHVDTRGKLATWSGS